MANLSDTVGLGGAVGWILPESITFPDDGQPSLAYSNCVYKISRTDLNGSFNFVWDTGTGPLALRNQMKAAIRADLLEVFGLDIPVTKIKTMNNPE